MVGDMSAWLVLKLPERWFGNEGKESEEGREYGYHGDASVGCGEFVREVEESDGDSSLGH